MFQDESMNIHDVQSIAKSFVGDKSKNVMVSPMAFMENDITMLADHDIKNQKFSDSPSVKQLSDVAEKFEDLKLSSDTQITNVEPGNTNGSSDMIKLGEYIIFGYNGTLPQGDRGRRRSKYVLFRRPKPNGVVKTKAYRVKSNQICSQFSDSQQHTISYSLSKHQTIMIDYNMSENHDLFQIGRSSESPIDFVVMDTIGGNKTQEKTCQQSTISRFACRILTDRTTHPPVSKIYAGGFDSSRNIVLNEKASKWEYNSKDEQQPHTKTDNPDFYVDGLTTNGVLILHPKGVFSPSPENEGPPAAPGIWREVSVDGNMFGVRESRSGAVRGPHAPPHETNVLVDGTLIDLCGATILWRSAAGLSNSPTVKQLERCLDDLNAGKPQCPVGLQTLVLPTRKTSQHLNPEVQPVVYLNCGHVQGQHEWGKVGDGKRALKTCPICMMQSDSALLMLGCEPGFYVDCDVPSHCFVPCGHMATARTVKYWSKVPIPCGVAGFRAACPFCAVPLDTKRHSFIRLIYQESR